MDTKLTLRLDKDVIEQIKTYALRNRRSVSAITEDLYKKMLIETQETAGGITTPIAKKFKGIIGKKEIDTEAVKLDYLEEKHLK